MIEVSEEEVLNYCCGNGNSSLKDKYISFEKQNDRVQNEIKITISNFAMITRHEEIVLLLKRDNYEILKKIEDIDEIENIQMYSERRNLTCDKKTFMNNLNQKYENALMCDFESKISQKCKICKRTVYGDLIFHKCSLTKCDFSHFSGQTCNGITCRETSHSDFIEDKIVQEYSLPMQPPDSDTTLRQKLQAATTNGKTYNYIFGKSVNIKSVLSEIIECEPIMKNIVIVKKCFCEDRVVKENLGIELMEEGEFINGLSKVKSNCFRSFVGCSCWYLIKSNIEKIKTNCNFFNIFVFVFVQTNAEFRKYSNFHHLKNFRHTEVKSKNCKLCFVIDRKSTEQYLKYASKTKTHVFEF